MLLAIYRFLCGYLYVRVNADRPEKILNLCAAQGISVWRVLLRENTLYFKIGIKSFKRLRLVKRKTGGRIHITKKAGLPFFVARNRKRYGMAVGIAVFFFTLHFMSGFIWNVCISGNNAVDSAAIADALQTIGVCEGARAAKIDPEEKRNELLLEMKELSWAAINIEGSRVTVDVIETKFEDEKDTAPSNLKAGYDGIVRKIEVIKGNAAVKVGDAVRKGDLLVSGMHEYSDQTTDLTRARGKIYAEVNQSFRVAQPLTVTEYLKTGETDERSVLRFFGLDIPLFFGKITGTFESEAPPRHFSDGESYLPVEIYARKFFKTCETTYTLTEEQAKQRATQQMEKQISDTLGECEILQRNEKTMVEGENLVLAVDIKCIKDIVLEEKILLDTRN